MVHLIFLDWSCCCCCHRIWMHKIVQHAVDAPLNPERRCSDHCPKWKLPIVRIIKIMKYDRQLIISLNKKS